MATVQLERGNQDNREEVKKTMEKRDAFALDTNEVSLVAEAIEARVSLLRTLPPSEWRDSRLRFLDSFMEKLNQLMEQAQLGQTIWVGMD